VLPRPRAASRAVRCASWLDQRLGHAKFGFEVKDVSDVPVRNKITNASRAQHGLGGGNQADMPCVIKGKYCVYYESCSVVKLACERGHVWTAVTGSASCYKCPLCPPMKKTGNMGQVVDRSEAQKAGSVASRRGGILLSSVFEAAEERGGSVIQIAYDPAMLWPGVEEGMSRLPAQTPVRWKCAEGHTWTSLARNVVSRGFWCPSCAAVAHRRRAAPTIEDMRCTAADRGGKCLSEEYLGSATKLQWQCSEGHIFWQSPNNVRRKGGAAGSWCRICAIAKRRSPTTRGGGAGDEEAKVKPPRATRKRQGRRMARPVAGAPPTA